jgi:hypothetical protein
MQAPASVGFAGVDEDPDDPVGPQHRQVTAPAHPRDGYGQDDLDGSAFDDLDGSAFAVDDDDSPYHHTMQAAPQQGTVAAHSAFEVETPSRPAGLAEPAAEDPVAFLRQRRMEKRTTQEQVHHFIGQQLVTAHWSGPELESVSVDVLTAVVTGALQEAHYEEAAWLKELDAMVVEGVLEEFIRVCVQQGRQGPQSPQGPQGPQAPQPHQEHPKDDQGLQAAFWEIFMGTSPNWYKQAVVGAMALNVFVRIVIGAPACAWCVLLEFIGTLAMATHCCARNLNPLYVFLRLRISLLR